PHPLGAGDHVRGILYTTEFERPAAPALPMETAGWKPLPGNWDLARRQYDWDGGPSGSQRPGAVQFTAPGSRANPLWNRPPKPGLPLAAKSGEYSGASLWFATGLGDYEGRDRGKP